MRNNDTALLDDGTVQTDTDGGNDILNQKYYGFYSTLNRKDIFVTEKPIRTL